MGKILFQKYFEYKYPTKKYLKYKSKYIISKVFKIQVPKYLLGGGAKSNCLDICGNVIIIKFCLILSFFSIND